MADMESGENISLKIEAKEVIKEISFAVDSVYMSDTLESTDEVAFFNLRTKENDKFCVELSVRGYRIVGCGFDTVDAEERQYYETIYALLDTVSPQYRNTFGDALMRKLEGLKEK